MCGSLRVFGMRCAVLCLFHVAFILPRLQLSRKYNIIQTLLIFYSMIEDRYLYHEVRDVHCKNLIYQCPRYNVSRSSYYTFIIHIPSIQIIQYQEKYKKLTFQLCMFIKMKNMNRPRKLQASNWKIEVEL